ncbi:MAG: hypothetical protein ACYTHM_01460 [Planctomycetota bacterium]|jgi:hypothetical protein
MKWNFDAVRSVHVLEDAGTQLARISLRQSSKGKELFRVKTLVSFLYFSPTRQKQLERSKKEWQVTVRKFPSREEAERHIQIKKEEVARFIRAREA